MQDTLLTYSKTELYEISPKKIRAYGMDKFIYIYGLINDFELIQCTGIGMTIGFIEITTFRVNRENATVLTTQYDRIYLPFFPRLSDESLEAVKYLQELNK